MYRHKNNLHMHPLWNGMQKTVRQLGYQIFLEFIYINKFVGYEIDLYLLKVFLENAKSRDGQLH